MNNFEVANQTCYAQGSNVGGWEVSYVLKKKLAQVGSPLLFGEYSLSGWACLLLNMYII
jgi:hypothetical protein